MALPTSVSMVGWYRFGSRPLDRAGATVLAGHVDSRTDGVGPLAGLAALVEGNQVKSPALIVIGEVAAQPETNLRAVALEAMQ